MQIRWWYTNSHEPGYLTRGEIPSHILFLYVLQSYGKQASQVCRNPAGLRTRRDLAFPDSYMPDLAGQPGLKLCHSTCFILTRDPRIVQSFKSKCKIAYFKIRSLCCLCKWLGGTLNNSEFVTVITGELLSSLLFMIY